MRSTSGMTCCHFFCSAVFSIPVWRNPMVVSALTIVSPESCTTMFSTPCVLGCCGPMLTVIVSVRSSGIGFNHFAQHVDQRLVHFLDPLRALVRHVHMDVGDAPGGAAVAAGERHRLQPLRLRRLQ